MLKNATKNYVEQEGAQELFCADFSSERPQHCESMFGTDVFWPYRGDSSYFWNIPSAVNGCGTENFLESLVTNRLTGTNGFTGNVDEPLAGFSFETACNSHDICYNSLSGHANCDLNFHNSLREFCSSNYDCETFANLYGSLVRTFGRELFTVAGKTQE